MKLRFSLAIAVLLFGAAAAWLWFKQWCSGSCPVAPAGTTFAQAAQYNCATNLVCKLGRPYAWVCIGAALLALATLLVIMVTRRRKA